VTAYNSSPQQKIFIFFSFYFFKIDFTFLIYKMEMEQDNKYQQGKIYKIVCNISNEIYIGSTIQTLNQRLAVHKSIKVKCSSYKILERGDYKIELIKNYPCKSKWELEEEEAKYIRENECINKTIPHRTYEERYEDNKVHFQQYQKKYREDNREYLKEYDKNRKNKKERYENNKKFYQLNKEEINKKKKERITCECGSIIRKSDISRHRKSIKHIKFLEEKSM
tara:strand:- start:63 stop:731 length:669 start_codon:yes stop_codon:yes gene_type:complete